MTSTVEVKDTTGSSWETLREGRVAGPVKASQRVWTKGCLTVRVLWFQP